MNYLKFELFECRQRVIQHWRYHSSKIYCTLVDLFNMLLIVHYCTKSIWSGHLKTAMHGATIWWLIILSFAYRERVRLVFNGWNLMHSTFQVACLGVNMKEYCVPFLWFKVTFWSCEKHKDIDGLGRWVFWKLCYC